jgi:hypothetical protein
MVMSVPSPRPSPTLPPIDPAQEMPASWRASLGSAMHGVRMQVDRENVLTVRSVLLGEAERLAELARRAGARTDWVGRCGGDPVSVEVAEAFNARIGQVVEQCRRYAAQLREAGTSLDDIARRYGYTDAQIAASFHQTHPRGLTSLHGTNGTSGA